jgi:hypothetical protein
VVCANTSSFSLWIEWFLRRSLDILACAATTPIKLKPPPPEADVVFVNSTVTSTAVRCDKEIVSTDRLRVREWLKLYLSSGRFTSNLSPSRYLKILALLRSIAPAFGCAGSGCAAFRTFSSVYEETLRVRLR